MCSCCIYILVIPVVIFRLYFLTQMQAELEKVKKRKEERALEKAQHEEEMVSLPLL